MKSEVSPTQRVLDVWAIILIIWCVYRTKLRLPEWFDEFVAKPTVFILPVYFYVTRFEKKDFLEGIWLSFKNLLSQLRFALVVGVLFAGSGLLANYVKHGTFSASQSGLEHSGNTLLLAVFLSLATAISEEIVSRGFILKRLYEESGNIYSASFLGSILFLILHIPILFTNQNLSGSTLLLFLLTDFILSLVNSFIFLDRKSLVPPILIHALYNLSILLYI
jgi:membrane protease YdiL (CAAX protease family)